MRRACAILTTVIALGGLAGCGRSSADRSSKPADGRAQTAPVLVVLPTRGELAVIEPRRGVVADRIAVGASPWGVAVRGDRAYVSAARHVAVVDLRRRRVIGRVPYTEAPGGVDVGEYRAGGMGIAVAPGGRTVYVGVYPEGGGRGRLEVLDVATLKMVGGASIGERPFDVLTSRDGRAVFTVDHDSYGVTVIDARTMKARFRRVAPLGRGAFSKLNYGEVDRRNRLLLPINGEVLAVLDPRTGRIMRRRLRSRVHQAGVVLSRGRLLTVGAESLTGGKPNLSVFDLRTGRERVIPLERPHEDIAVSNDGRVAYLTGGYTRGGWRGISAVSLRSGRVREIALDDEPLGIAVLPSRKGGAVQD